VSERERERADRQIPPKNALPMEIVVDGATTEPFRLSTSLPSLEFRSLVLLSDGCVLAAGALVDPENRVGAVLVGRGDSRDLASIALGPGEASSSARRAGGFGFLGALRAGTDALGLALEIRFLDGGKFAGWVPAYSNLEPFREYIDSIGVEGAMALAAQILTVLGVSPANLTAPETEKVLAWIEQRIDADRNASVGDRGSNAFIDGAERIEGVGFVIKGWMGYKALNPPVSSAVVSFSGRRGEVSLPLAPIRRPDVVEAMSGLIPTIRHDCGFIAYAPLGAIGPLDSHWFFEVRFQNGAVLRAPFRLPPARNARAAIQGILDWAEVQESDLGVVFEQAIDTPISILWARARLRRNDPKVTVCGRLRQQARLSVIVPLYGRLDLMRHQLAQFSNDSDFVGDDSVVDLIYVLDDPRPEIDFEANARLAADLYDVPFRLIDLHGNFGYSTANNVGASFATGSILILLNSDVIPKRPGWASQLANALRATPNCGVLGCRLLYEDGSIQHAGMTFREASMLPGAFVNDHPSKGLSVVFDPHLGVEPAPSVTGACLAIPRVLFQEVGGLTEDYIIGDFEDSDLCMKVRARGLEVCYTPNVEHYHLERLSMRLVAQDQPAWRHRLTLFNMWRHGKLWRDAIGRQIAR
jgi:O-antigen biosynthesis protein